MFVIIGFLEIGVVNYILTDNKNAHKSDHHRFYRTEFNQASQFDKDILGQYF